MNILLLLLGGYVLSVKQLKGRMFFQYLMFFTMIFSGGLVPYYLIVRSLGLINSLAGIDHSNGAWALAAFSSCAPSFNSCQTRFRNPDE